MLQTEYMYMVNGYGEQIITIIFYQKTKFRDTQTSALPVSVRIQDLQFEGFE